MNLVCVQLTSAGDRLCNQDAMINHIDAQSGIFVVADGLGGHKAGDLAARFFCLSFMSLRQRFQPAMSDEPIATLIAWVDAAVDGMARRFQDMKAGQHAHTTCAILYLDDEQVLTAHCGDSRVYRIRPDQVLWRTKDHSLPQQLVAEGMINERELSWHPEQNRLTRSINILKLHQAEIRVFQPPVPGETFVLCTDGFWSRIKQEEWLQLADPASDKQGLTRLAKLAIARAHGKSDNVTVQWIRCR